MKTEKKIVTKSLWELQFGDEILKQSYSKRNAYVKTRTAGAKINGLSI